MRRTGSGGIAPRIPDLGTRLRSVVRFTLRPRNVPDTHWIGGWVGSRAGLDAVVKRKILSPCRDSNTQSSVRSPALHHWAIKVKELIQNPKKRCYLINIQIILKSLILILKCSENVRIQQYSQFCNIIDQCSLVLKYHMIAEIILSQFTIPNKISILSEHDSIIKRRVDREACFRN
jgi:hypothetical protein